MSKGKMYADFGAYMAINNIPYYTLLAEIDHGGTTRTFHKDLIVLTAEMWLCLEFNVLTVAMDNIDDLRMYGLLITQTSAEVLIMRPQYNKPANEVTYVLKEGAGKFDFDPTMPPQQLIEETAKFFAFIKMASDPDMTGITEERVDNNRDKRGHCKHYIFIIFFFC